MKQKQTNGEGPAPAERLAYSMHEVAGMLGLSYGTVWNLCRSGRLRSCGGLRVKRFTRQEIERFLKE